MPKKVKHRKWQKGRERTQIDSRGLDLAFGSFGLKALESCWLSARQIEAARRAVIRYLKKGGKFWVRIFPNKPVTRKGTEVPMGGGKGAVDHYAFSVRPGRVLFELEGLSEEMAKEAFARAGAKLPIKTKFIKR